MRGRPLSDARVPDGETPRVRSVSLPPHLDALVAQHAQRFGFRSTSAALEDLISRGLNDAGGVGAGESADARVWREAAKAAKAELERIGSEAIAAHVRKQGAAGPRVVARRR